MGWGLGSVGIVVFFPEASGPNRGQRCSNFAVSLLTENPVLYPSNLTLKLGAEE